MKEYPSADAVKLDGRPDVRRARHVHHRRIDSQEVHTMVYKMSKLAGGFAAVTALTVACDGGSSDRAGGAGNVQPVTLTMAQVGPEPPDQLRAWADEVSARTDGRLVIEFANRWREGELDFEARTIEDVQAGKVDMAWVGARVFDTVGVNSFQPLLAPMLVDSHDLQAAVFEAGIPAEMIATLDAIDLAAIGVLPGPMRKVLGVTHPFVAPADFEGEVVGMQDSALTEQTMIALGSSPRNLPGAADIAIDRLLSEVDAYEQQIASIAGNDYWQVAEYISANVNLWPRPLVMFMNGDAFASLPDDEQAILRDAAAASVDDALASSRAEDADSVPYLCTRGMSLTIASDDDLAALRAAVQPVYDQIAADPTTAAWLDEITALKDQIGAPPDTAECPARSTAPALSPDAEALEGTYQWTLTAADAAAVDLVPPDELPLPWTGTLVLADGLFRGTNDRDDGEFVGTYEVFRDVFVFTPTGPGEEVVSVTFTVNNTGDITATPTPGTDPIWTFILGTHPWERVAAGNTATTPPHGTDPT